MGQMSSLKKVKDVIWAKTKSEADTLYSTPTPTFFGWRIRSYPDTAMVPIGRLSAKVLTAAMIKLSITRILDHWWVNILLTIYKIFSEC